MKYYSLILLFILPLISFSQDPDVQGEPIYGQVDEMGPPFQRNERVCFVIKMGAVGADLIHPTPQGLPFETNVSTQNMIDRTVEFITSNDEFLDQNFFDVDVPDNPNELIVFTQNSTIPIFNYSWFNVCGTVPETADDGSIVKYQANADPGGYPENEGSDDPSNEGTVLGVLPIELLRFEAIPGQDEVQLEWETATELNNSHFDIERSGDGRHYQKIGEVAGQGTTSEVVAYAFTDEAPLSGRSFYRLRQVDFDGSYEYSAVEEVNLDSSSDLKLFPNPAPAGSEFQIRGPKIRNVKVFNILGQLVMDESYDQPQDRVYISTDNLTQGMYITRINDHSEKRMIIK